MTSQRAYYLMLASTALLCLAILGGVYGAKQLLVAKSAKLLDLKATHSAYNQQKANLAQAKKDIASYAELYEISKAIVPENKNQAETVRQIVSLAEENYVSLGSISFPTSTLGTAAGKVGSTAAGPSLNAPKAVKIGNADLSQLTPVMGSPGVYVLPINVSSDSRSPVGYNQLIAFLSALERNRLTAEITNVNIVPDTETINAFSFTLSLNCYIKP